jgi:hypothetical protein
MERRQFLAGIGGGGLLSLAGCTVPGTTSTLSSPTREQEDDGDTHLYFESGDERLATLSVQPSHRRYRGTAGAEVPLVVSISHREATKISSIDLRFRVLSDEREVPAQLAVTMPQWTPRPSVEMYTTPDGRDSRFIIDEMGAQGSGALLLEFLLQALGESARAVEFEASLGLQSEELLGRDYSLNGQTEVPLPES